MRPVERWECQSCLRFHKTQIEAANCHPPQRFYICGHCEGQYEQLFLAESCGLEEAGSSRVDIEAIKRIKIND